MIYVIVNKKTREDARKSIVLIFLMTSMEDTIFHSYYFNPYLPTSLDKNNETNEIFSWKVTFLMYIVNFRPRN